MKDAECEKCGVIQYGFSYKDLNYRMSMHQRSKKCQDVFDERMKLKDSDDGGEK